MVTIRQETASDREAVFRVNQLAFDSDEEPRIVERLRRAGKAIISLVAEQDGEVVGHVLFSPMTVESEQGAYEALTLGPVAVLPQHQGRGLGSALIRAGLEEARRLGYGAVFLLGHPAYYPRFGFRPAREFDVRYEDDRDAFMAVELVPGALDAVSGRAVFAPEFFEDADGG